MKTTHIKSRFLTSLFCGLVFSTASATTALWDGDPYSGSWSNVGSGGGDGAGWATGSSVPNGIDDVAQWDSASYYGGGGSLYLTTLTGTSTPANGPVLDVTLGRVELNATGDNRGFTLFSPTTGTSTLTFDVSSGNAAVQNATSGKNCGIVFDINVTLNDDLDVSFNNDNSDGPRDAISFNQIVAGSSAINKSGIGRMRFTGTAGANTFSGGLNITNGEVIAEKSGALGTGDVIIQQSSGTSTAQLSIMDGISDALSSSATVSLFSNTGNFATLDLGTGVDQTIAGLFFDGVGQATGTWGSSSSSATNTNDDWFSGAGMVTVIPEPSSILLLGIGFGLLTLLRRNRR